MKNGKLLILLAAILSFTLLFTACNGGAEPDSTQTTGTESATAAVESDSETVSSAETQEEETEQAVEHEIRDYLVLGTTETDSLGTVERLDASLVSFDKVNGLATLKTQDLDAYNNVIDTYKVYNVNTGEVILEKSVSNLYQGKIEDSKTLTVTVKYPTIRVSEGYYSVENSEMRYNVTLYVAKKDSSYISSYSGLTASESASYSVRKYDNGLVAVTMNADVQWIDRDMNVIRSVKAIAQNGYYGSFNAEYQGYLYAWNNSMVKVFNRAGLCSGEYFMEHDGELNVHVLDNGNVLIQDAEIVDQYTPCSFVVDDVRYQVKSYVMNYVDGTLTEVALDYVVYDLETAYAQRYGNGSSAFPFALASGRDNQAYVYRFATGEVSPVVDYVVINNDLQIEYTVKNDTVGVDFEYASGVLSENYYYAAVESGNINQNYIFDLDGNALGVVSGELAGNLMVADDKIYDIKMNVVLDTASEGYTSIVCGNTVYLKKYNYVTGAEEFFLLDGKTPRLIADGINATVIPGVATEYCLFDGYYFVSLNDGNELALYTVGGEELILSSHLMDYVEFEGGIVFEAVFDGREVVYVVK